MKISRIAKLIIEAEDDKYAHIGYGKYKEKGKEDDEKAPVFNKTDSGKYVKSADASKGDDSEKDSGAKLGGGDFDRDGGDSYKPSPFSQDKIDKVKARQAANDPDDMGPLTKKRKEKEKKKGFLSKMFGKKESITINGKKYKAITEDIDDDKIIKYKDKDGESAEMKAGSAKTMSKDHPAKIAYDKMVGGDDSGKKASGDKLGSSDFDRGDDMDRDARFDADAENDEKSSESENEKIISSLEDMDLDGYNVDSLDSAIDSGQYASITGKDADEPDNEMSVNAFPDEDGVGYAINFGVGHGSIYLSSKEEALEAAQRLLKNDKIRKAMDGESEETLADLHGKEMISVAYGFNESITINGKQYKAIKEDTLNENPAAIAAAQSAVIQAKAGKKVSVNTARQSSYAKKDPAAHKKAKSMWQKIKDRFSKKESMKESKEKPNPRVLKENYDRIFRSRK